jgi:hypothetical protein
MIEGGSSVKMLVWYTVVCGIALLVVFWPTVRNVVQPDDLKRDHHDASRYRVQTLRGSPAQVEYAPRDVRPAIFNLDYDAAVRSPDADPGADRE